MISKFYITIRISVYGKLSVYGNVLPFTFFEKAVFRLVDFFNSGSISLISDKT